MISMFGRSELEILTALKYYDESKELKMTREEAIKIMDSTSSFSGAAWITRLEALGLLKFEEKINKLFEITESNVLWPAADLYQKGLKEFNTKYGTIRLEEWPEGLVLWVGGQIVWKSCEESFKIGDLIDIEVIKPTYYGQMCRGRISSKAP